MTIDGDSPLKSATVPMSAIGRSKANVAESSDSNLPASKEVAETFCDNSSVNVAHVCSREMVDLLDCVPFACSFSPSATIFYNGTSMGINIKYYGKSSDHRIYFITENLRFNSICSL